MRELGTRCKRPSGDCGLEGDLGRRQVAQLAVPSPRGSPGTGTQQTQCQRLGPSGFLLACCLSQTTEVIHPCESQHPSGMKPCAGPKSPYTRDF